MIRAYLHSEDVITPQALDILREVKQRTLGDTPVEFAPAHEEMPENCVVFALGKYRPARQVGRVVPAPSVAQIVTKADIVTRLGQAFHLLAHPPQLPEYAYEVLEDPMVLYRLCMQEVHEPVAFDIETSGDDDRPEFGRVISCAFYKPEWGRALVVPELMLRLPGVQRWLEAWLMCARGVITTAGKFDLSYFPGAHVPPERHFDTMLAHYSLFPAAGEHGLKPTAKRLYGFPDWDEATKKYRGPATYDTREEFEDGSWHDARRYSSGSGFERIPRALLYEYNGYDVYAAYWLYVRLREMLAADTDARRVFDKRMRLSEMFQEVENHELPIDVPYLRDELAPELEAAWDEELERLHGIAGGLINPNSPKQVTEWFALHDRPLPKQKCASGKDKGLMKVSSSEASLEEVLESTLYSATSKAFATTLLELRHLTKQLGTYVRPYVAAAQETGTLRPDFNLAGPITGRLANYGPGVMTIPRDPRLRRMILPSGPGRVLVKPDYGQLEMRIVAAESGDERFLAAFQPGMPDFFVSLMPSVFPDIDFSGWTEAEMKKSKYRSDIKPVSHGLNYGRGTAAIAAELDKPVAEVQRIVDRYLGPEGSGIRRWQAETKRKAVSGEDIVTRYGFRLQAELVTDKNKHLVEKSALSFVPQSTGNDMCLSAALRIHPQLEQYDAWIIATVHDQIIIDAPIRHAKAVGELAEREMVQEGRNLYGDLLVFEASPEYGFNWAQKLEPTQWDEWLTENSDFLDTAA